MLELVAVLAMASILAALVVPAGYGLLSRQQLNAARDEIHQAMRTAQDQARVSRMTWQFSIRDTNGQVQWAIHPATVLPAQASWASLSPTIQLDEETTLQLVDGIHRMQFSYEGRANGQLGRVTLSHRSDRSNPESRIRRCVIVSTLLGELRKSENQRSKRDEKYCY